MREIPKELWAEILEVTRDIVWGPEQETDETTSANMERFHAIYARQNALGQPDPFLTEVLADFTDDAAEAIALYRIALSQSDAYPDEPTHTKHICLASRLIEIGDFSGASSELIVGRAEAVRSNDSEYLALADDLLSQVPPQADN
jgi:hypothetical protein